MGYLAMTELHHESSQQDGNSFATNLNEQLEHIKSREEMTERISSRFAPIQLDVLEPANLDATITSTPVSQMSIHHLSFGADTEMRLCDPEKFYTIHLPYAGSLTYQREDSEVKSTPGCGFIISPGHKSKLLISGNCEQRVVKISKDLVESRINSMLEKAIPRPVEFEAVMNVDIEVVRSWWDAITYLETERKKKQSIYYNIDTVREFEKVLVIGLLSTQEHNYSEDLRARNQSIAPAHVRRAEHFIQEFASEEINLNMIVEASQVRKRTLYDSFKRFRGISPMCYLRSVRLSKAREELMSTTNTKSVTEVALYWRFGHMGRFSMQYKKRFGELPSKTAKVL